MAVEFGNPKLSPRQEYELYLNKTRSKKGSLHYLSVQQQEFLKLAENEGLIQTLTEKILINSSRNGCDKKAIYAGDARIIYLSYMRLKDISILDICERLEICILNNNFIQNISPLKWCCNLMFLDLHSNLINYLPGPEFWFSLKRLSVLHLHDNGVSKLEELRHISHAPSLLSLTLYDTPMSLKKTYRHCAVNAIWTLKSLDQFVVSDEEIIEDADFPLKFKPMQPHLHFRWNFSTGKRSTCPSYKKTFALIRKDFVTVNRIHAKYSPILMIQKWIRGFLIRLRYNYLMDTRLWAAVSIQRFYRSVKGYPSPPPTSPNMVYQESLFQSLSSIKLDYETYLKMRRSRHKSSVSMRSDKSVAFRLARPPLCTLKQDHLRKHISVDLGRLEGRTTELSQKEASLASNSMPLLKGIPNVKRRSFVSISPLPKSCSELEEIKKPSQYIQKIAKNPRLNNTTRTTKFNVGKYTTQDEFLRCSLKDRDVSNEDQVGFRLTIKKPHVMLRCPLEELILRTVEGAEDIRKSAIERERRVKSVPIPKVNRTRKQLNADEKLYMKTQGTMGLSCFYAVDKAYKDRNEAEKLLCRRNFCRTVRESERKSIDKIRRFKEKCIKETLIKKHDQKGRLLEALAARRNFTQRNLDESVKRRLSQEGAQQASKNSYKFAQEFGRQNNSVAKALLNHDHMTRKSDELEKKKAIVLKIKNEKQQQKDVLKEYLEQTKMARQAERMNMRGDTELLLSRNEARRQHELADLYDKHRQKDEFKMLSPTLLLPKEMHAVDFIN